MEPLTDDEITLCGHPGCDRPGTLTDGHGASCVQHFDDEETVVPSGDDSNEDKDSRGPGAGFDEAHDELGLALVELGAAVLEEVHAEMRTPEGQRRTAALMAGLGLGDEESPEVAPQPNTWDRN